MGVFFAILGIIGVVMVIALIGYVFKIIFAIIRFVFSFIGGGVLCFIGGSFLLFFVVLFGAGLICCII